MTITGKIVAAGFARIVSPRMLKNSAWNRAVSRSLTVRVLEHGKIPIAEAIVSENIPAGGSNVPVGGAINTELSLAKQPSFTKSSLALKVLMSVALDYIVGRAVKSPPGKNEKSGKFICFEIAGIAEEIVMLRNLAPVPLMSRVPVGPYGKLLLEQDG